MKDNEIYPIHAVSWALLIAKSNVEVALEENTAALREHTAALQGLSPILTVLQNIMIAMAEREDLDW